MYSVRKNSMEIKAKVHNSGKLIGGIILILIGLLLLEDRFGFDFLNQIFPLILIGLGIAHMVRRRNQDMKSTADSHAYKSKQKMNDFQNKVSDFETNLDDKVSKFESKIDDFEQKIHEKFNKTNFSQNFEDADFHSHKSQKKKYSNASKKNGQVKYEKAFGDLFINCKGINVQNVVVSSAIGDIEMQMRDAIYTDGLNRLIISHFIGDVLIYIPKEIPVFVNCSNFIGDVEAVGKRSTGFGNKVETHSSEYETATRKLYIACSSFIGDIRIISS